MQKPKIVVASVVSLLPLLSNAHPGDHEHLGNTAIHHSNTSLVFFSSTILLLALLAIRKHLNSQSIERTRD